MDTPPNPYQRSQYGESSHSQSPGADTAGNSQSSSSYDNSQRIRAPTKATRRIRGEIACAECRRLKVRCDRNIPCSTCVKRGCSALCPNGTIPPGEGSRFVLAATDHLRRKTTKMEARMRSLEDALAIINDATFDSPHPLLTGYDDDDDDDEPSLKAMDDENNPDPDLASTLTNTFGTLWLDERGSTRFFGPSGGSESLLLKSIGPKTSLKSSTARPTLQELDPSYLSVEINQCYQSFPFTPQGIRVATVKSTIEAFLPSVERAITLCDTFLEHLSWMFSIISRRHIVEGLISAIYKQTPLSYGPHDLALLLIVLGIGSLVDLDLPPYNLEAQHYYRLARAALALQPVLAEQSMVTIKVLHLMSVYNGMSGKESNLEQSYVLLDLASQVALRIGFHIDPSSWGFDGREGYDRRVYFWNLMAGVLWQSLITGRPPSLLTSYIDCKIPSEEEEDLYQLGEVPLGFGIWGFKASKECLIPLVRATLAAKPPKYSTILELDRQIRTITNPQTDAANNENDRTAISMRIFVRSHYQDLMLLFLHRAYFAQAMAEHPANPLNSPYGQSVFAAYSSACHVLRDTREQFMKKPLLCSRIWRMWTFSFTAAVIVGTVAIRGLHLNLRPAPLEEFEAICLVFRNAAEVSSRAARALPVLEAMLQKALQSQEFYRDQGRSPVNEANDDEELSLFGGKTKVISSQNVPLSLLTPEPSRGININPILPPTITRAASQPLSTLRSSRDGSPGPAARSSHTESSIRTHELPSLVIPSVPAIPDIHTLSSTFTASPSQAVGRRQQQQPMTIADLSGGWDSLFNEVPGDLPSGHASNTRTRRHTLPMGDGVMLNDRWSSFMQTYGILGDPRPFPFQNQGRQGPQ